jgi:hypothetical protein
MHTNFDIYVFIKSMYVIDVKHKKKLLVKSRCIEVERTDQFTSKYQIIRAIRDKLSWKWNYKLYSQMTHLSYR